MFAQAAGIWSKRQTWGTVVLTLSAILIAAAICMPNLQRSREAAGLAAPTSRVMPYMSGGEAGSRAAERIQTKNGPANLAAPSAGPTSMGGMIGGVPASAAGDLAQVSAAEARKIILTGSLDLIVASPSDSLASVQAIAHKLGGYVASSQMSGSVSQQQTATVVLWIPAAEFETARNQLRGLAKHVDSEQSYASDATMQYVDTESELRNLRAEEARYLEIMKRAVTVKDTLDVSEKLAEVRGKIDTAESEFRALSHQIDMSSITVNLAAEPMVSSAPGWRPLYRVQQAARLGLESLADFVANATEFIFQIPAILLWAASIFLGIKLAWYVLKRAMRSFGWIPKPSAS